VTVYFPTHHRNHTLDLATTSIDTSLALYLSSSHISALDHFPVFTKITIIEPTALHPQHFILFAISIDTNPFLDDLKFSLLITNPDKSLGSLLNAYNATLLTLLDKQAPVITKLSIRKSK